MKDGIKWSLLQRFGSGEFNLMKTMNWDESFGIMGFDYASDNRDQAYGNQFDSDKARIVLYDLKKGVDKEVFSHPDYDEWHMARSKKKLRD